jgi:hypothetical protein
MKTFLAQNQFMNSVDGSPPSPTERTAGASQPQAPGAPAGQSVSVVEHSSGAAMGTAVTDLPGRAVAADEIQSSCGDVESRHIAAHLQPYAPSKVDDLVPQITAWALAEPNRDDCRMNQDNPRSAGVATSPQEATNFIGEIFRGAKALFEPYPIPRLALPRFVPDYEAMQAAMHDPGAPRLRAGDPVWADASPLFLRQAIG